MCVYSKHLLKGMFDPDVRRGAAEQIEILGEQAPDLAGVLFGLITVGMRSPPTPQVECPASSACETHSDPGSRITLQDYEIPDFWQITAGPYGHVG